ncbi:MAG: YbaK/EbsC family protein [Chloroflexota bacterium]
MADVQAFLAPLGIQVVELPADASTAASAARALNTPVASIAKSLLFQADDHTVLVIAGGDRQVDIGRLSSYLGAASVRLARPAQVLEITGYAVGGVPPIAHAVTLRTVMDSRLLAHETVYAAAGAARAIFPIGPQLLSDLAGAELAEVT